jgi:hypothetical protein
MIGILAERHHVFRFALRESVKEGRVQQRFKLVVRDLRRRVPYASPYAGACCQLVCEIDQVLLSVCHWLTLPLAGYFIRSDPVSFFRQPFPADLDFADNEYVGIESLFSWHFQRYVPTPSGMLKRLTSEIRNFAPRAS